MFSKEKVIEEADEKTDIKNDYKIIKQEERKEDKKMIKIIYVESNKKKEMCPICNEYTRSIHDKLRPIELKYLKIVEYDCKINIIKKDLCAINVIKDLLKI